MTNIQAACLTIVAIAWLVLIGTIKPGSKPAVDPTFAATCQLVGGVTVFGTTPGTVHCVSPIRSAP